MYRRFILLVLFLLIVILFLFYTNTLDPLNPLNTLNALNTLEGFDETYTAVIVEPREHKALSYVLKNALENLDQNWNIIIMYGNKNKDFVANIIDNDLWEYKKRITSKNLNIDNLRIDEYNDLLTSKEFYENIPTEVFLIFQTDSIICNKDPKLLNDFIKYDYVGAPWKDGVGNGGFSLRRKSKILEIIENCQNKNENEDLFFAKSCVSSYKPSIEEAKKFSIETLYNNKSFAAHKPWVHLNKTELENTMNQCLPLRKLWELNK